MIAGTNLNHMMSRMQKVINKLTEWDTSVGLKFNPSKTVVVIFGRRKIPPNRTPQNLVMQGKSVEFSTSMKYLGVTLDEKLNWDLHLNLTIKACKQALMFTSNIIKKKWGPKRSFSKWLYM